MPYDTVKNIHNNTDEMWKKLEEKYGKTSILADLIMNEIKWFRAIKDKDVKRFIEFVDIVAKGYKDFSRMKVDYQIQIIQLIIQLIIKYSSYKHYRGKVANDNT